MFPALSRLVLGTGPLPAPHPTTENLVCGDPGSPRRDPVIPISKTPIDCWMMRPGGKRFLPATTWRTNARYATARYAATQDAPNSRIPWVSGLRGPGIERTCGDHPQKTAVSSHCSEQDVRASGFAWYAREPQLMCGAKGRASSQRSIDYHIPSHRSKDNFGKGISPFMGLVLRRRGIIPLFPALILTVRRARTRIRLGVCCRFCGGCGGKAGTEGLRD